MKPQNTGTILDNYKFYTHFQSDTVLTVDDLKKVLDDAGHIGGVTRAVSRHVNCNKEVFIHMTKHEQWYVRIIGYFHYKKGCYNNLSTAAHIVAMAGEDTRIMRRAWEIINSFGGVKDYITALRNHWIV